MSKKTKPIIKGKTVYEINKFTGQPTRIVYGVGKYFRTRGEEEDKQNKLSEEEQELNYRERLENSDDWKSPTSAHERHEQIASLMGNKKKRVSKADGLDKEIAIDETEHEPVKKKDLYNRYRKQKSPKTKSKRKVTKCRCKK
jgi:hypothetical protein